MFYLSIDNSLSSQKLQLSATSLQIVFATTENRKISWHFKLKNHPSSTTIPLNGANLLFSVITVKGPRPLRISFGDQLTRDEVIHAFWKTKKETRENEEVKQSKPIVSKINGRKDLTPLKGKMKKNSTKNSKKNKKSQNSRGTTMQNGWEGKER